MLSLALLLINSFSTAKTFQNKLLDLTLVDDKQAERHSNAIELFSLQKVTIRKLFGEDNRHWWFESNDIRPNFSLELS